MTIKSFEEFKNENSVKPEVETLDEGLINAIKSRKEIIQLQCAVCDEYEKMLEKNPEKFKSGKDVLKAVEQFAKDAYKKIVKNEEALSFEDWWESFA